MSYRSIYKVLIRTVCVEYYRLNAGFFFVIIAFAFGLLRPIEHIAIATYLVHSHFLMALVFGLWTVYTLKTIQFTLRTFAQEENLFLHNIYLLPTAVKFSGMLLVQFILYEPIVLYSAFMGYYAIHFGQLSSLLLLGIFNLVTISGAAAYYVYRLPYMTAEKKQNRLSTYLDQHFTKPYFTFFLYQVLQKQRSLYFLTKLFSLFLLTGTVKLYTYENFSPVLLALGGLMAFSTNAILCFHFNRFEQLDVLIFKNLPLSLYKRFFNNTVTYLGLLVPEILLLMRHLAGDIDVWLGLQLVFFGLSLQLIFHGYVLFRQLDLEKFIRHVFFLVIFYFVSLLFRIPILLLFAVNGVTAFFIYQKYFYQAEVIILKDSPEE
ncbi:hypothetical protein Q0590_22645 [Rhodocytophaga aerolata]|uniref:Uncharacterized protein n=1 Tax=Rhodocytophaga aerolata TaxID=455078 RepID=A0ABT8RCY7_9BACT|nr:hypothetical protein [Rhodocytophaga aerolata]MDO1449093.1 hypothetical protein [Rhodocytophaga aerolata]